jgi:hypothetical protein
MARRRFRLRLGERGLDHVREILGPLDLPVVQEHDPRRLVRHVVVDGDDVDPAGAYCLQSRLRLRFRHREISVDDRLVFAAARAAMIVLSVLISSFSMFRRARRTGGFRG